MSEDGQKEGKVPDDILERVNKIKEGVDEKLASNTALLTRMGERLDKISEAKAPPPAKKEPKDDWDAEWEEEKDEDLEKLLTQRDKTLKQDFRKIAEETTREKQEQQQEKNKYDGMALNRFPVLRDVNHEFTKEVVQEMGRLGAERAKLFRGAKTADEIIEEDPTIYFDAANRVYARDPARHKSVNLERERAMGDAGHGSFSTPRGSDAKPKGPSEGQLNLAKRMGMNLDRFKKNFSNYTKETKDRR